MPDDIRSNFVTVVQVGFEMAQYTFSEGAGQVIIHIARENTVIISQSFTVEMALLPTSTAQESGLECFFRHLPWI